MVFEEPYMIGLLLKKSDKLYIDLNEGFNYTKMFFGNLSEIRLMTTTANAALPMTFDWTNEKMALMRSIAKNMYWGMIGLIASQFIMLMLRRVGLLPVWILIEYLQLIAFMPIYNFRLIPYLYDAFKPALVSHMILFDRTPLYDDLDNDYFNTNYEFYWLSVGKLFQAFFWGGVILVIILILNLIVFIFTKCNIQNAKCKAWFQKKLIQFKFNLYIRYYMLIYFDSTFFSVMKILEGNNTTTTRKLALVLSYVLFVINIVMPVFLITIIYRRFEILKIKEAKQSFNSLLLQIDKASKVRVVNPAYFFFRRLITAVLLTLPIQNTFIFL